MGTRAASAWRSDVKSGRTPDVSLTTMRRGIGRSSRARPAPSHGSTSRAGFFLGKGPHLGDTGGGARNVGGGTDVSIDVAAGCGPNLNRDFTAHFRLPIARRADHQHRGSGRERCQECHNSDDDSERPPGNRILRHDRRGAGQGANERRRCIELVPGLRHSLDWFSHRHASVPRAGPAGGRRTRPSARCRGWR